MTPQQRACAAKARTAEAPKDVTALITAAYACDSAGDEEAAVTHYDTAWRLGVPTTELQEFLVGYGSTLRNVGRSAEAITLLTAGLAEHPNYAPYHVFLALAQHSNGTSNTAIAGLLGLVLDLASDSQLDGFKRAIRHYQAELAQAAS